MASQAFEELGDRLLALHGRSYAAYKSIAGTYSAPGWLLAIDHVQGDPFAEPSRLRVLYSAKSVGLPPWALSTAARRLSTADFFNRALAQRFKAVGGAAHSGPGKRGLFIQQPGQQVLARTSLMVHGDGSIEARFRAGLPSDARRIDGHGGCRLLTEALPKAVQVLSFAAIDGQALKQHVEVIEDAQAMRQQLQSCGLVAFVGNGAILPRKSGEQDEPLSADNAQEFVSPASLQVTLVAPNAGQITGMAIGEGTTLIVGGGYHGKSTLLRAIERGIYDHIPGDGRQRVVTLNSAVKVRANDRRAVSGTDISNFINHLPGNVTTQAFVTASASGSTSQAAAISEALEVGCRVVLLDEDTSATNFMIRDGRMQALVADEPGPITPLVDRIKDLQSQNVSTIIVVGGSGAYFDVADTVIGMQHYTAHDWSQQAKAVAQRMPSGRQASTKPWQTVRPRFVDAREYRRMSQRRPGQAPGKSKVLDINRVRLLDEVVELGVLEQVAEVGQTHGLLAAVSALIADEDHLAAAVAEALGTMMSRIEQDGLDALGGQLAGDFAEFRIFELAAFLHQLRRLQPR